MGKEHGVARAIQITAEEQVASSVGRGIQAAVDRGEGMPPVGMNNVDFDPNHPTSYSDQARTRIAGERTAETVQQQAPKVARGILARKVSAASLGEIASYTQAVTDEERLDFDREACRGAAH